MGLLAPLALVGLLAVPLIVAFYMLRLRRPQHQVSSTYLWQQLVRDVAMHIAASGPAAVSREDIPADLVERERAVYREQMKESGKPEQIWGYQRLCIPVMLRLTQSI